MTDTGPYFDCDSHIVESLENITRHQPSAFKESTASSAARPPRASTRIPDARAIAYPDCGHAPNIEAADRFNADLLDFLAATYPPEVSDR